MKLIKSTLCCYYYSKINQFFYSAQLWARKTDRPCSIEDARTLYVLYVCKNHFCNNMFIPLFTDFTTTERKE
jgi:hypothetical protein